MDTGEPQQPIPLLCNMFAWIQSQLFKHYSSGMVVKAGCKNSCRYLNFRLFSWGMRHSRNHKITAKKQHLPINAPDEQTSDTWQRNLISLESSRKNPWMVSCNYLSSQSVNPSNWSLWGLLSDIHHQLDLTPSKWIRDPYPVHLENGCRKPTGVLIGQFWDMPSYFGG